MPQRSIRFPAELYAAVEAEAVARDRSFSYVVIDAVRCHLRVPAAVASVPVAAGNGAIPSRDPSAAELNALDADLLAGEQMRNGAPVKRRPVAAARETPAMARQRKLNEAKAKQ